MRLVDQNDDRFISVKDTERLGFFVVRQALVTQGETGYLVTDCSSGVTREVIDEILGLEATKRLATIQAD